MKRIVKPELTDAKVLSPLELNKYRFSDKHTVLTPDQLEKLAASDADVAKNCLLLSLHNIIYWK